MFKKLIIFMAIATVLGASDSMANRRRFTYTYESPVLPKGTLELEIWNTLRTDRNKFYRRMEHRMELEAGLGGGFQTALYLNQTSKTTFDATAGDFSGSSEFSISNEWKWSLSDPTADFIGAALYGEWTLKADEQELEGKLILDKNFGDLLAAANVVFEHEAAAVGDGAEDKIIAILGLAYQVDPSFTVGLEARHHTVSIEDKSSSALNVGPSLSYSTETGGRRLR
jgi:hypothetical protein